LTFAIDLCSIVLCEQLWVIIIMKRLNIYRGLAITFALVLSVTWVCRHRVILPDITDDRMFSVHEIVDNKDMVDIELHLISNNGLPSNANIGEKNLDIFDDDDSIFGNKNQGVFSQSAPRGLPSRKFNVTERDSDSRGLFWDDSSDVFSDINSDSGVGSWGWLADDIQTAERGGIKTARDLGRQQETRRLFSDGSDRFGKSSEPNRNSGDNSVFRRQDLRW
jgi:hypothetical protein